MSNCSHTCPEPGTHTTWGECVRAKGLRVAYCQSWKGSDATAQKKWDAELASYRSAVAQGMEPRGTTERAVREAVETSQETGEPFRAA